jgi:glutamine cyclotransferase
VHVKPLVVRTIAHDTLAFTQGLLFRRGRLYESTGIHGQSSLREIDTASGSVAKLVTLDARLFGEGLAVYGDLLVQLTWQSGRALVYSLNDFSVVDAYTYSGEGWGLTAAEGFFVMSNGSDTLYRRDSRFAIVKAVPVTLNGKPLTKLNELEYARGMVYANVWYSSYVFEIDANTGRVRRIVDCSELVAEAGSLDEEDVLNGIAYDQERDTFYLTGKNWPMVFEVQIPAG